MPITLTTESWMLNEDGTPILEPAIFHRAMNDHYREKYGGLSRPVIGDDIFDLPQPAWALENLIQENGFTLVHAKQGSGKTFMTIDWALVLNHPDRPQWMGQKKQKTYKVMYVMTEGFGHLPARVKAWMLGMEETNPKVVWVRDTVRMQRSTTNPDEPWSPQVTGLMKMYHDNECNLLILDTLANTFVGNENQQQDANQYLDAIRMFQEFGPVVVVHHNTKGEDEYRGSTVLAGAADTMVSLKQDEKTKIIQLRVTKQKDGEPDFGLAMRLKGVDLGWQDKWGGEVQAPYLRDIKGTLEALRDDQQQILSQLQTRGRLSAKMIAEALDADANTMTSRLKKMETGKFVTCDRDVDPQMWSAADKLETL